MKKDLPNIYKGKINKNLNQEEVYVKKDVIKKDVIKKDVSVNKQIKDIFNSSNFIYKADTLITLNNGDKVKKTIIGKTNNSLITMDDELIDINSISQIETI